MTLPAGLGLVFGAGVGLARQKHHRPSVAHTKIVKRSRQTAGRNLFRGRLERGVGLERWYRCPPKTVRGSGRTTPPRSFEVDRALPVGSGQDCGSDALGGEVDLGPLALAAPAVQLAAVGADVVLAHA